MIDINTLITDNIELWSGAIKKNNTSGKGSRNKSKLIGVEKLRELIVELALRGKLVCQQVDDEPAHLALKRTNDYLCAKLGKKALPKFKRDKSVTEPSVFHYQLPELWTWCELQQIALFTNGKAHEQFVTEEEKFVLINSKFVSNSGRIRKYATERLTPLDKGDIAMVMSDVPNGKALAKCYLVEKDDLYTLNQRICGLKTSPEMNLEYLLLGLNRNKYLLSYNDGQKQSNLKKIQVMSCPLAIPPLKEQNRIVIKVQELMDLCDQLEQQTEASIDAHQLLVEELLSTLTNSENAQEFEQNWARIAKHFDLLFTTEHSIEQLKQTILKLAVMGKLVPKSTASETSMELLQRVESVRKRLVAEEKLKTKANPKVNDEDKYIKTPERWSWCRLGNLAKFIDYRGKTPTKLISGVRLITAKNVKFGFISLEPEEFISKDEYVTWMTRGFPRVGDILFTPEAPLGNVAIVDIPEKFALAQRAICFQFHVDNLSPFFKLVLMSKYFQDQLIENSSGMTARGIKASKLKEIPIPVPPLNEQHKIVEVVNRFNSVCEQLQKQIAESRKTQIKLSNAIVEQALN